MSTDLDLLEWQTEALFLHDERGRIIASNEPDGQRAPLLFLGRSTEGAVWRFRDDVPHDIVAKIERLLGQDRRLRELTELPAREASLRATLARFRPVGSVEAGPAWYFPERIDAPDGVVGVNIGDEELLRPHFPWLADHLPEKLPAVVVIRDGVAVARCSCSRRTERVAEAGVDTIEPHRGQGLAPAVTAAWAIAVRASGRLPLYSTSWENTASRQVAAKLGLIQYGVDWSLYEAVAGSGST